MRSEITKTSRVIQWVAYSVVALATLIVLYIAWLLLSPVEVLSVQEPLPASPTAVKSGDIVTLQYDYCKYQELTSHITIDFIGPYVVPSLSTKRDFKVGCHTEQLPFTVPASTPSGVYTIHLQVDYQVNPLRGKSYEFDSVQVNVTQQDTTQDVTPLNIQ